MLLAILWLISAALAAQLELSVDAPVLESGQTVGMKVKLINGTAEEVPRLTPPDGLTIRYTGRSHSQVIVNRDRTTITEHSWALTAVREGRFRLGPAEVKSDGRLLRSNAVEVKVTPPDPATASATGVSSSISDPEPYLGQVVLYQARYQRVEQNIDARWSLPEFNGFIDEKTAEGTRSEYASEINGQQSVIEELRIPLLAVGVGQWSWSGASVTAQIPVRRRPRSRRDMFFERTEVRTQTWASDSIDVIVRPLPEANKPAQFSGLVGVFTARARASKTSLTLGESVTVEVRIEGTGTLSGYALPSLPADSGLRAYDDKPDIESRVTSDGFRSVAVFKRAIVPERDGEIVLPALVLNSFNPDTATYETFETSPIRLTVAPGEVVSEIASFSDRDRDDREQVESLGDDILPASGATAVRDRTLQAALPWAVAAPLAPLVLLLLMTTKVKLRRGTDRRRALRSQLKSLPADPTLRLAALEDLFRETASLQLGTPAPSLDAGRVLALGEEASRLYADLQAARYGQAEFSELEARVLRFVREVL